MLRYSNTDFNADSVVLTEHGYYQARVKAQIVLSIQQTRQCVIEAAHCQVLWGQNQIA